MCIKVRKKLLFGVDGYVYCIKLLKMMHDLRYTVIRLWIQISPECKTSTNSLALVTHWVPSEAAAG